MIVFTFLYDEYIDQPKMSEQKNPFEYIVPSPTSGVGTISDNISQRGVFLNNCTQFFLPNNEWAWSEQSLMKLKKNEMPT